jgi:hypothetical protein
MPVWPIFEKSSKKMSEFKPYLHSAHIEGYKSIVSCDVTFKPGLNIIIGKNGTGKTNLLEGLKNGLSNDFDFLDNEPGFATKLTFANDENVQNRLTVNIDVEPTQNSVSALGPPNPKMDVENRIHVTNFYKNHFHWILRRWKISFLAFYSLTELLSRSPFFLIVSQDGRLVKEPKFLVNILWRIAHSPSYRCRLQILFIDSNSPKDQMHQRFLKSFIMP